MFNDESEDDGSGSGSPGTCAFPFCSGNPVGRVITVGSGVFVLTVIDSICYVVPLVVFVPRVLESKCGRLIEFFGAQKYGFSLLVSKSVS